MQTDVVNVDGVQEVGLVLGAATDPKLWKDTAKGLILYKVKPQAEGLTGVTITEEQAYEVAYAASMSAATPVPDKPGQYRARMNGNVWSHITHRYTMDEVAALLSGHLSITDDQGNTVKPLRVSRPSEMQIRAC